jgi:methionyl aminopeptidase
MSATIKTSQEIELMKEAGRILAITHEELEKFVRPGISTWDIDKKGEEIIRDFGCIPSFLNYEGFPASICVSINEEIVHGIPKKNRMIQEGDLVSLDAGVIYKGYHSDAARTLAVGEISKDVAQLVDVTRQSFFEGIKYAKAGNHLFDISNAIDNYVSSFGYGIVQELVGHGIGKKLHEDPEVPNFRQKKKGMKLYSGMTLAIEPMITQGSRKIKGLADGWTIVTEDGSLSAHYENTILITDGEPEILSLRQY